jgi:signal transduction histidine kinase
MLSYARSGPPTRQSCFVNQIVEEVCELMEGKARERRVRLVRDLDPSIPPMTVDPEGIHTSLLNLITNAIEAFPETGPGGEIIVGSRNQGVAGIGLQVVDTGRGMTKEVQGQIFKQFYSTKGSRGTGLGLAITQKIVREHGGTIQVESEPGKGTCFTILLPLAAPPTFRP